MNNRSIMGVFLQVFPLYELYFVVVLDHPYQIVPSPRPLGHLTFGLLGLHFVYVLNILLEITNPIFKLSIQLHLLDQEYLVFLL